MLNTQFAPWPFFDSDEIAAVSAVLRSGRVNYWTGDEARQFEREFAAWSGTRYAVALANGTLALDVALKALGVGPGDEVVVTPRTFIASVSCVVNAGAIPVFADVDRDSGNITAETIARVLSPKTRAIICVHLAGWPCDMDAIMALASQRGIYVIEDCAQAHGALYKGRAVGSIGHVGAWSFCQDKIMTTGGEGGMVTTNDDALWRAMWAYKDHGKSYEAVYEREHAPGFRWLHESFGTNWRMLEMQAVIGRIQLKKLADWSVKRAANAAALRNACQSPVLRVPDLKCSIGGCGGNSSNECSCAHANYKFYAYVEPSQLADGWSRDRLVSELVSKGVPCFQGSCSEVYLERAFDGSGWRPTLRLPVARELGERSIMLLVHPTLTTQDIERATSGLRSVIASASK